MKKFLVDSGFEKVEVTAPDRDSAAAAFAKKMVAELDFPGEARQVNVRSVLQASDMERYQTVDAVSGKNLSYPFEVYNHQEWIADAQIEALSAEAGEAGDLEQVALCQKALVEGDLAARAKCEKAIRAALAQGV